MPTPDNVDRLRLGSLGESVGRLGRLGDATGAVLIGRVCNAGAKPTTVPSVNFVRAAINSAEEASNAPRLATEGPCEIPVVFLGPRVPAVDDEVIARLIDGVWVAQEYGVPNGTSCANGTLTVNVRDCTNQPIAGRPVRIRESSPGFPLLLSGTTNASGQFVANLPSSPPAFLSPGGRGYRVEVDFASETRTTNVVIFCGQLLSITVTASGCPCLSLAGKTVTITTPYGAATMLRSVFAGTPPSELWAAGFCVPTSVTGATTDFFFIDNQCLPKCDPPIANVTVGVVYIFRCDGAFATLSAQYRVFPCPIGGSAVAWRPAECNGPCLGPNTGGFNVGLDQDTIPACDICTATSLGFALDMGGLGLGTDSITVSWV